MSGLKPRQRIFRSWTTESSFTDDSVLTVAVADWVLHPEMDLVDVFHHYFEKYPHRGYGGLFHHWAAHRNREPYNSFGNGSAMRVSPVGFAFDTMEEVLLWAERSAAVTHNHPEGVRGAQATAAAIFLARRSKDKKQMRNELESRFGYDLGKRIDEIRPTYRFSETCQETVPQAIVAFLESTNYEDAIRNAISLGGDADTLACIAGGVAEAYYGSIPQHIAVPIKECLDPDLLRVTDLFYRSALSNYQWQNS